MRTLAVSMSFMYTSVQQKYYSFDWFIYWGNIEMPQDEFIGRQVGNYIIVNRIASGSFGRVYKGHHSVYTDRFVAIKILHMMYQHTEEERKRFLQEAHLLEMLKHPHILPIIDVGFYYEMLYIVTEYALEGSLRDRLRRIAPALLSQEETIIILTQIAEALQYAHQRHVIHRDLKPENILFKTRQNALLADFGVATVISRSSLQSTASAGTPLYMSPEQFQNKVSKESDQYALACIAYELFTGRVPFDGGSSVALMFQHLNEAPLPPSQINPAVPATVERAILKALSKKREDRYGRVMAFVQALQYPQTTSSVDATLIKQPSTTIMSLAPTLTAPLLDEQFATVRGSHVATEGRTRDLQTGPPVTRVAGSFVTDGRNTSGLKRRIPVRTVLIGSVLAMLIILASVAAVTLSTLKPPSQDTATTLSSPIVTHTSTLATKTTSHQSGMSTPSTKPTSSILQPTATTFANNLPSPTSTSLPTQAPLPTATATPSPIPVPLNLQVSPSGFSANRDCTWVSDPLEGHRGGGTWNCNAKLTNPSGTGSELAWSVTGFSSNGGTIGTSFAQMTGVLAPGESMPLNFTVSMYHVGASCPTSYQSNIVFAGPNNTVTISWSCSAPIVSVSTTTIGPQQDCTLVTGGWQCTVVITLQTQGQDLIYPGALNDNNVTFNTLDYEYIVSSDVSPSVTAIITIPTVSCPTSIYMTIAQSVTWSC